MAMAATGGEMQGLSGRWGPGNATRAKSISRRAISAVGSGTRSRETARARLACEQERRIGASAAERVKRRRISYRGSGRQTTRSAENALARRREVRRARGSARVAKRASRTVHSRSARRVAAAQREGAATRASRSERRRRRRRGRGSRSTSPSVRGRNKLAW